MNFVDKAKKLIEKEIGSKSPINWSYPPQESLGHLSFPCFIFDGNPVDKSEELTESLKKKSAVLKIFKDIKAVGPYLNFFFKDEIILNNETKKIARQKGAVLVEFSNANTHKEYHIGHLRNISYGDSVVKILRASGQDAKAISYINDFGIHTAKTVWQLKEAKNEEKNKGAWLGKLYAQASAKLHENPELKETVSQAMANIESLKGPDYKLWQKSRKWSIKYFAKIYKELDIKFDHIFYEHEVIASGLKTVKELEKKNILEMSQGALIANLEKYKLGVLPFIRSDGTALYPVADIELAKIKAKKYKAISSIYVVDIRQSLYFKQLFKVLELSGAKEKLIHLAYEFVSLPEGAMSSRSGNIVSYPQGRQMASDRAFSETKKRHEDWSNKKISQVANELAIAALKFEMLKVGRQEEIVFSPEQALRFDGYTAVYIEYTYARLQSLKNKVKYKSTKIDWAKFPADYEIPLAWKIAKYPEAVAKAAEKFDPAEIAKYLFELAKNINDYYQKVNIIKSDKDLQSARLEILNRAGETIKEGLNLLGIKTLKEM